MGLEHDIHILSRVGLFEGFPDEQLRLLAFGSEQYSFSPDEMIYQQGDLSNGGYVVISGEVEMVTHKDDTELSLGTYQAYSLVGEVALISVNRRTTTAIARMPTKVMHIPRAVFRRMLDEYPELAILLHERIGNTVKELIAKMQRVQVRLENIPDLGSPVTDEPNPE